MNFFGINADDFAQIDQSVDQTFDRILANNVLTVRDIAKIEQIREATRKTFKDYAQNETLIEQEAFINKALLQISSLWFIDKKSPITQSLTNKNDLMQIILPLAVLLVSVSTQIGDDYPLAKNIGNTVASLIIALYSIRLCIKNLDIIPNRKQAITDLLNSEFEDKKIVDHFEQKENKSIIFSNSLKGELRFDRSTNTLETQLSANLLETNKEIVFMNKIFGTSAIDILYQQPTADNLGGSFAGFKYLTDGETNFSGNLLITSGEYLISVDNPFVKAFENIKLEDLVQGLITFTDENHEREKKTREFFLFHHTLGTRLKDIFKHKKDDKYFSSEAIDLDTVSYKVKDIGDYVEAGAGNCRHQTLYLARILYYMKKLELLDGTIKLRVYDSVFSGGANGHIWLEYHNKETMGDHFYILDPVNQVYAPSNKLSLMGNNLEEYYAKFNNDQHQARVVKRHNHNL